MDLISIIVPCYNEEAALPFFYKKITEIAEQITADFEFIFVNDGSRDKTLHFLKSMAKIDERVKYISFSRNFGKEAAFYAGLESSGGDYVAVMDADLQDPPEFLIDMYSSLKNEDYDCVAARRTTREGEPKIRSFFARMFYKIINKISKTEITDGARDFRMMTRQMTDAILQMGEYHRFSKGIFGWVGFNIKWLEYKNIERVAGETKWSFWKLLLYSIEGIIAFSTAPLLIPVILGVITSAAWFILLVLIIILACIGKIVSTALILSFLILLLSSMFFFCLGIMGSYLSRTYLQGKNRPIYIIKEKN